ncbi:MAG TPA: MaoC family dehydratase [Candidatus Binatia bacterium]
MSNGFFSPGEVHVGQDLGGRQVVVTREEVEHYAAGTGLERLDPEFAPALLFHSEVYRDLSWYLPNIIGNLHARQEWELFAPFTIGAEVRSRVTVVDRYRKRDRLYVVAEVLWTTPEGRWLQRSRTHQSFLAHELGEGELAVDRQREKRSDRRFETPSEGEEIPPGERTVTLAMCQAFSGPHRNYHNDREMARALGFPDIVVQGMMPICFVSDTLAAYFGAGWHYGGKLDVRLVNVVWVEDRLKVRGRIREVVREGSKERCHLDVWCEKADGTIALIGTASALRGD